MKNALKRLCNDDSGQGLAEYAVLISLVTLALVILITPFRDAIGAVFTAVTASMTTAAG